MIKTSNSFYLKVFSAILAIIIVLCASVTFTSAQTQSVWDGSIADNYANGTGTESDPFIIENASQLAKLVNERGRDTRRKHYKLANDIVINDDLNKNPKNWYTFEYSTATSAKYFAGYFDGNGHTVSGLYINKAGADDWTGAALFPRIDQGGHIYNLGIVNSSVTLTGRGYAGAIVGIAKKDGQYADDVAIPSVERCFVDDTVTVSSVEAAGGIAGCFVNKMNIIDCYSFANVSAKYAGGLVGDHWTYEFTAKTSISKLKPMGSDNNALTQSLFLNVFSLTTEQAAKSDTVCKKIDVESIYGDNAKKILVGFDFYQVWQPTENTAPLLRPFTGVFLEPEESDIWDGSIAENYAGGTGTKDDPYQIEKPSQLAKLINDVNTRGNYYKLTADMMLNDTSLENWLESSNNKEWYSVNNDVSTHFCGNFDGDGHIVSGLFYDKKWTIDGYRSGLFPMIGADAVIKNVGVKNSYLKGFGNVAAIVGWARFDQEGAEPIISGCYADETVIIKGLRTAGIVCASSCGIQIDNCYFRGYLEASAVADDNVTKFEGGMLTYSWVPGLNLINCYSIDYPVFCSGITGSVSLRDCYGNIEQKEVRVKTKEQMTGENARKNMSAMTWDTIWRISEGYPELNVIPSTYKANGFNGIVGSVWTGQIADDYAGGSGTENDPYLISTGEQLAKFVNSIITSKDNPIGVFYKLTDDIILNDTSYSGWESNAHSWMYSTWWQYEQSKGFRGNFDGDGHVVSGIYLNVDNENGQVLAGLIPVIGENGNVKKVGITNSHIRGYDLKYGNGWIGGIVGYCYAWELGDDLSKESYRASITECFVDQSVVISGQIAGGILGASPRSVFIDNCYFTGTVLSETDGIVGGIFGYNWNSTQNIIQNCYVANAQKSLAAGKKFNSTKLNNVYAQTAISGSGAVLSLKGMRGENAINYMNGFDFSEIWYACKDGTPVLRAFGTSSKYSNKSPFEEVEISFVTNGGTLIDPIYGEEDTKINWPITKREGYEFAGWYVYKELDVEFPLDAFPMNSLTLYAKWNRIGFEQNFENYDETLLGDDYELYKFTQDNFDGSNVHGGLKSVHRVGLTDLESSFVLFDKELTELESGKEYKMQIWVKVESAESDVVLNLCHLKKANAQSIPIKTEELATIKKANFGKWELIEFTFIANGNFIAIKTLGNCSIYFDDMYINATGKSGSVISVLKPVIKPQDNIYDDFDSETDVETENNDSNSSKKIIKKVITRIKVNDTSSFEFTWWMILIISVASVLIITGIVIIVLRIKKKRRKVI